MTVGMPSFLSPQSGFGIPTLRTGCGVYFPPRIRSTSAFAWFPSFKCACVSSMVMPSTPAAPLFAFTLLKALFRFSLLSIFSKSSACTRFLSSHIRRNDLDAPAYSSCSARSFCGQPFSFRFSAISSRSSFPGCTWILLLIRPFTSRLLWPLLTSAYAAQPCGCGCPFPSVLCRPPRVPHVSFPPSTCRIYHRWFRVALGLQPGWRPYPQR